MPIPTEYPFAVRSLTAAQVAQLPAAERARVLGVIAFGDAAARLVRPGTECTPVRAPQLHPRASMWQVWFGAGVVEHTRFGALACAHDGTLMFGSIDVVEDAGAGPQTLARASELAYRAVFDALEASGYRHLLRVWNYFPAINDASGGLERYRAFNVGRQDAFLAAGRSAFEGAPAACALGTTGGGLAIRFLAAREAPRSVENPRQTSAYRYPADYGPRSPTFSRAALARLGRHDVLFVSGTASIVGHATVHAGDVAAQTAESLRNIEMLIDEANRLRPGAAFTREDFDWIVYLRRRADLGAVRAQVGHSLGAAGTRAVYVLADICRSDLLVEVEATGVA